MKFSVHFAFLLIVATALSSSNGSTQEQPTPSVTPAPPAASPCPEVTQTFRFEWRCRGIAQASQSFEVRVGPAPPLGAPREISDGVMNTGGTPARYSAPGNRLQTRAVEDYIDSVVAENPTVDFSGCISDSAQEFQSNFDVVNYDAFGSKDCKNQVLPHALAFQSELGNRADIEASLGGVMPLRVGYDLSSVTGSMDPHDRALFDLNRPKHRRLLDADFSETCLAEGPFVVSRQFLRDYLPGALSTIQAQGREGCVQDLIQSVLEQVSESLPSAEKCTGASDQMIALCNESRSWVQELVTAFTPYLPPETRRSLSQLNACWEGQSPEFALGLDFLARSIDLAESCVQPQVGEEPRRVNTRASGINAYFLLSRPSANEHLAQIPLRFIPSDRDQEFRERANFCLDGFHENLLGPGGHSLRIELIEEDLASGRPPLPTTIQIQSDDYRANSLNWDGDINCSTILHEILHLLGLVDEYKERWIGYHLNAEGGLIQSSQISDRPYSKFSCRSLGPPSSVMANQEAAVLKTNVFRKNGDMVSLLRPAHFRLITQPGCESANRLYYACSQGAYQTRYEGLGQGCERQRPSACQDPEAWLR
jgi:hypothetical protein